MSDVGQVSNLPRQNMNDGQVENPPHETQSPATHSVAGLFHFHSSGPIPLPNPTLPEEWGQTNELHCESSIVVVAHDVSAAGVFQRDDLPFRTQLVEITPVDAAGDPYPVRFVVDPIRHVSAL